MDSSAEDTVMAVSYDYLWANRHDLIATQPYVSGSVMRISRRSGTEPKSVAVVESGYLANEVSKSYPELSQIPYQTFDECMNAVAEGSADCTFLNYYQASWFRQLSRYESFSYQPIDTITQGISLGVTRESNPVLAGILSKSLQHISGKDLQSILINDTAVTEPLSLRVLIKRYPIPMALAISAFAILISLLIGLSVSSGVRKRRNLALAKAKEEAEQANEAKSVFLSNMSHDLRTPLNGILGFAAIGLQKEDVQAKQQCLQKIQLSGDLLLGLVNDTLELSRIESGKMKLDLETFDSREIIRPILESVQQTADAKGVRFIADTDSFPHGKIKADRLKLQKIVLNLLSNAVKFTPAGGTVRYAVEAIEPPSGGMTRRLIVADTGIGMSPEFLNHLYEPFSQERRPETAGIQGTGLGLSIVKRMVDLMKGTIAVQSELGKGTTFTVELPLICVQEAEQTQPEAKKTDTSFLAGKRILLCEDNAMNTEIAVLLLEEKKMLVECAADGREGLEKFAASPEHYYDCVLMDIRMPVMDGLEAARRIRALKRGDANSVPIIAMSADAFDESVRQAESAGMNDYLTKPVEPQHMYELLERSIRS
jgi:signal transduction histidine kinase/BarA-like signal transduction histidine kinase